MASVNSSTAIIVGVAAVVLIAAVVLNVGLTGKAVEGDYKCITNANTGAWPERVIKTGGDRTFDFSCPETQPYCDEAAAIVGAPECCVFCPSDGSECAGCTAIGTDVQYQVA